MISGVGYARIDSIAPISTEVPVGLGRLLPLKSFVGTRLAIPAPIPGLVDIKLKSKAVVSLNLTVEIM